MISLMYCPNCGSKLDQDYRICPFCGKENSRSEIINEKNGRIQELEEKVIQLEQKIKEGSKSEDRKWPFNLFQPWIFIFPLIFVILFFVLFIALVSIR